jgi:recombination protein RecT
VRPGRGADQSTTAIAKYLGDRTKMLASYAGERTKPETLVRLAVFEFSRSEFLRRCSPESIYASLILAAQIGLEPSGIRGEAYLVPFKGQCTLVPGWRGLVKLALKSRAVRSLYSHVAYSRDFFEVRLGTSTEIVHRPCLDADRGEIVAAYAVAKLENGEHDIEVMTIGELEHVRSVAANSRGGKDGPAYAEWADQMYRKAPIRRIAKRLPLGDDFYVAAKLDELHERGEKQSEIARFIDVPAEVAEEVAAREAPPDAQSLETRLASKLEEARRQ